MNFSLELFGKELSFGKAKSISAATSAFISGEEVDSGGAQLRNAYGQSAWVYIAISRLSEKISALPFIISNGNEKGSKIKRRSLSDSIVESGDVVDLFNRPHSTMNRQLFWEMMVTWAMLRGEFFILPLDKEGHTVDLKSSNPGIASMLTLDPVNFYHIIDGHELSGWRYTGSPLMSPVSSEMLIPSEVIHSRSPNPYLYWRGMSPLAVASVAAGADFAASKYNAGYWLNNADTGLVVTSPPGSGWPTKEQREEISTALRERKRKAGTPDRPMFLGGGLTVEKPQLSGMESQFIENRKMNRQEILAIFKMSDSVIGLTDAKSSSLSGGGASIGAEELKFVESTIKPLCSRIEAALAPIIKSFGPNLVGWFDVDSLPVMQESRMMRVDTATKAFALGASFNDINRIYDLGFPDYDYGDRNYLPFNLQDVTGGIETTEPDPATDDAGDINPVAQMSKLLKRCGPWSGPNPSNGAKETTDKSKLARASYNRMASVKAVHDSSRKKHFALFASKYNKVLTKFRASTLAKLDEIHMGKAVTKDHSTVDIIFDQHAFGSALFVELSPPIASVLQVAGDEMMKEIGLDNPWKNPPKAVQQYLSRRKQSVVSVGETARFQLNTALVSGTAAGETTMEIADRIRGVFNDLSKGQAQTVATTEVNAAYSDARHDAMKEAGIEYKSWLAPYMPGRQTHKDAQEYYMENPIPIDDPFIVDGENLMHPCDESGSPENVINCHCIQLAVKSISQNHFNVYGVGEIRLR